MRLRNLLVFAFLLSTAYQLKAQIILYKPEISAGLLNQPWESFWITDSTVTENQYNVCHFRKIIELKSVPEHFIIHVSADNYYRLLVNGKAVGMGPARNDVMHWNFDTYDIAKLLKAGENILAAVVWNFNTVAPNALKSRPESRLSFIVQGNTANEKIVNTNNSWKVYNSHAYSPNLFPQAGSIGALENIDGTKYPWNWQNIEFNDSRWNKAVTQQHGYTLEACRTSWIDHLMQPRPIPMPEERTEKITKCVRRSDKPLNAGFIEQPGATRIPANNTVTYLFDQGYLTNSFPELTISKGKGSLIKMTYAEALVDKNGMKQNRNRIEGMHINGYSDIFKPDGGEQRLFRTLWFRTYRYLELEIKTGNEELVVHHLTGNATGYPLYENGYFKTTDPVLKKMWEVGCRTARLCAYETYTDCPYYEQLQYIGDTRIQALISLYVSGDDQLMRNAIEQFNNSRYESGLTSSCYPSIRNQIIPPFSLFWILMIDDYNMHRDDTAFCQKFIPGIKAVLNWHQQYLGKSGMLENLPFWNFVDWPNEWAWKDSVMIGGVPEGGIKGASSILNLQYVYTLQQTAQMFDGWGLKAEAENYRQTAQKIKESVMRNCWDDKRQLLADSPLKHDFSQHANLWVILCDMIPQDKQADYFTKIDSDPTLIQCTIYYRFYLMRAMEKAGLADSYLDRIKPWTTMLDMGLSTFAERPEPTRSDCHAWSASPVYELLATVAGVTPASPGFKTVRIEPHFNKLPYLKCQVPHEKGFIVLDLQRTNEKVRGTVHLPESVSGTFIWKQKEIKLVSGENEINL